MQTDTQAILACAGWLKSLGLGNGSDRLHKYIHELEKELPLPASVQEAAQRAFVYLEASEFISVYEAYKGVEDEQLIDKLERAVKGCHTLTHESSQNNCPRNTMFELALAAGLKLRGVDVELGEPDLIINFPKGQYVVECKRPFRETGVRANVREAESQLRMNLKPGQNGVIAISLSRIINPGSRFFVVEVGNRDAVGAIHGSLQTDLHHQSRELMRGLATLRFSSNIAALMFHISTPCSTDSGEVTSAAASRFYPPDEPKRIVGKLRGIRQIDPAFTYLDDTVGDEVLNSRFSVDAQAEIDRMNRLVHMHAGPIPIVLGE